MRLLKFWKSKMNKPYLIPDKIIIRNGKVFHRLKWNPEITKEEEEELINQMVELYMNFH